MGAQDKAQADKAASQGILLATIHGIVMTAWMADLVAAIRGGNDELKKQLPFRCAHYYQFRDNRRSQKNAVPESFLFQTTIDVDDKEYVDKAIEEARDLNCSGTIWNGALLHLEYSARKKLHIDIRMPVGMTIEETQRAYCEALGVPYDESCITPERMLFITDKASEIYRSPHWYEVLPQEELKKRRQAYLDRGLTIDGRIQQGTQPKPLNIQHSKLNTQQIVQDHRLSGSDSHHAVSAGSAVQPAQPYDSNAAHAAHLSPAGAHQDAGAVATGKNLAAFDLFRNAAGLKDVDINTPGSRHSSLLAIMSAGASRVMPEDELKAVVAQKMPAFSQERDCQQLIHDFYAKYGDSSKPMSQAVIRINAQAEKSSQKDAVAFKSASSVGSEGGTDSNAEDDKLAPPPMPEHLPKLVELLLSKTPDVYKPAVAHAIFPPLATHLCKTTFRYIDNVEHEATLMCCLLAGTGAGKNCVQMPINMIMEDIRQRDRENLQREKEWKEEVTRKGANKDKRKRPENLIIQEIDADMTFYNGMIRASFDWFKKSTKDLLFQPTVEAIRGNNAAFRNLGNITNQGVEMQMTFNKNWNEINFSISANASYLKNEVVKIGNANGYTDGGSWRTSVNVTRMEEGHAMGYFRLYKNLGIFQNEEQIQNYKSKDGKVIQPDAVPGDFIWQDTNNDGQITDEDRTDCGNPWPKWTFGLNLGADWRGIDMTIFLTGKAGYKVFSDIYRQEAYGRSNLPSFYLDRWRKEGDDNGVPRLSSKDPNGNFGKPSDFYLYDGSHLKISSLEVGYSFPTKLINKLMLNKARIYAAIDNLATFTSYPFMDPEVGNMAGGNILSTGIDYGTYPQARTFRFGLSLNF